MRRQGRFRQGFECFRMPAYLYFRIDYYSFLTY